MDFVESGFEVVQTYMIWITEFYMSGCTVFNFPCVHTFVDLCGQIFIVYKSTPPHLLFHPTVVVVTGKN